MSFPHWCPWHIFSEAGVYLEALKSTRKPLKSPNSQNPCPAQVPKEASIVGSKDLQRSKSLQLQSLPSAKSLFAHLPIIVCTTQIRLLSPQAHVGLGRICRFISGQGNGGQAWAYGSKQSAGARRRGNKPRFLLPSSTLQEFRVTSFPPGEDSTAVFPRGFPWSQKPALMQQRFKGLRCTPPAWRRAEELGDSDPRVQGFAKRPRGTGWKSRCMGMLMGEGLPCLPSSAPTSPSHHLEP